MCDVFKKRDKFWLCIAPEGTRKSATSWKRGFYHIAVAAQVPIIMLGFDYDQKAAVFLGLFEPTGDFDADLPKVLAFYQGLKGRNPDNLSLPLKNL
jgi:1-acyl-sn-glycerol-3-phosphate acyltransferase